MSLKKRTIGILGAGQLAQMTCQAGQALGFEMHVYAQRQDEPAAFVADRVWVGDLQDRERLAEFARAVSIVTYDTELLPIESVRYIAQFTQAYPDPEILFVAQHRERERNFLQQCGIAMPRIAFVHSEQEAIAAVQAVGVPAVLKTAEQGYDGKGQRKITQSEEVVDAWHQLGELPCVLEEWLDTPLEMSVIVAGAQNGQILPYPVIDNEHRRHILHKSTVPSQLPADAQEQAQQIAIKIATELGLIGLLTVEMFYTKDGRVLVNELAPRPHNSGHHTQLSTATSQFEQLLRAVSGLDLGAVTAKPAAMINLLGDLFLTDNERVYQHVGFLDPQNHEENVYFYGKRAARVGRKLGHVIALGNSVNEASERAQHLYDHYAKQPEDVR